MYHEDTVVVMNLHYFSYLEFVLHCTRSRNPDLNESSEL